ncbi:Uu.00g085040.m01.CDS01 [Anthostomella pinea]|uniref:Uu.00g085040.m01.CDS01 n=1 Tax=Anthostomella pinea TaxID=933095 RepID=A0AAI8VLY3_9PEZI|nr:Uu.00g085040.m01.CDS01 [Anthostomella pinea]
MYQITINKIGSDTPPVALARYAALVIKQSRWNASTNIVTVPIELQASNAKEFHTKFLSAGTKALNIPKSCFSYHMARSIISYHATVGKIVNRLGTYLIKGLSSKPSKQREEGCTKTENHRIQKAVHVLVLTLETAYLEGDDVFVETTLRDILPPWEYDQVLCVLVLNSYGEAMQYVGGSERNLVPDRRTSQFRHINEATCRILNRFRLYRGTETE